MDVGENWTWSGTYAVTQAAIDTFGGGDGDIDNTATASCNDLANISDSEAVPLAFEGLTPGFWKNHTDLWEDYNPTDTVGSVFTLPGELSGLAGDTLLDALNYDGGSGVECAARNLLRHAVAALLNAAHSEIDYVIDDPDDLIDAVNTALATLDRGLILDLKDDLDMYNNMGAGIDAHGNPL